MKAPPFNPSIPDAFPSKSRIVAVGGSVHYSNHRKLRRAIHETRFLNCIEIATPLLFGM